MKRRRRRDVVPVKKSEVATLRRAIGMPRQSGTDGPETVHLKAKNPQPELNLWQETYDIGVAVIKSTPSKRITGSGNKRR